MKKLMIAFAAIAMAVVANAATCNWSGAFVALNTDTASTPGDITVYLMDSTKVTRADMVKALEGDVKGEKGWEALLAKAETTTTGIAQGTTATRWSYTGFGAYAVGEYTFYTVLIDATKGAGLPEDDPMRGKMKEYFMVSQSVTANAPAAGSLNMSFGTQTSNSWTAVPEPTSGLLLLLGVAGLALRRKQK